MAATGPPPDIVPADTVERGNPQPISQEDKNVPDRQAEYTDDLAKRDLVDRSGGKRDAALDVLGGGRIVMTDEQSVHVRRKIDKHIMPILTWAYFLQILDKISVGYGANFGMIEQTGMTSAQYSLISGCVAWAQLALCLGPTTFMIVKVPSNRLMAICMFCWGTSMIGQAFSKNFGALLATRFLLGLFEAVNVPLFTIIVMTWYRRREQPLRIAIWYSTNGWAAMLGSLASYGLSFVTNTSLYLYQIIFLFAGLLTVVSAPFIWQVYPYLLDNNPAVARFLTPEERRWAVERLRSNNTGVETKEIKWNQVWETFTSPMVILFVLITTCINATSPVGGTFGPLIIRGFGFTPRETILLNIPFAVLQGASAVGGCYCAARFGRKSIAFFLIVLPCVVGASLLYAVPRVASNQGPLLFGYYCLAFLFGANPLTFSWLASNTAGHTKKSLAISLCNAGSALGNIVGPFMFVKDVPLYRPGLGGVLGFYVAIECFAALVVVFAIRYNKTKEKQRVANGKPAKIQNSSMAHRYQADQDVDQSGQLLGEQAFADLTDKQNDEFIYTY